MANPPIPVSQGRFNTPFSTFPEYTCASFSSGLPRKPGVSEILRFLRFVRKYCIIGTSVIDSTVEARMVVIKILGSALMNAPFPPDSSNSGENVTTIARLDDTIDG